MKAVGSLLKIGVCALMFLLVASVEMLGQGTASLHASVANPSGTRVGGALVVLTNEASGAVLKSVTGPDGTFDLMGLEAGSYDLAITMHGFEDYQQKGITIKDGQTTSFQVMVVTKSVAESVTVTAQASPETSVTQATISRKEIEGVAGPFGSAAQALTAAPGVFVYGYGGVAATARSEVVVRGMKAGWSSVNGDVLRNAVTFLFDGIPMNNLTSNNGQWSTTQIPIMDMISNINVDYGPGAPSNRWYDSIGGTANYIPSQPTLTPDASIALGTDYGSYNTTITHFIANSGLHKGWSALLAAGYAANDTFRVGTTGIPTFNAPSSGYSAFFKVEHPFQNGTFSIGYYHSRNTEFRPNFIPLVAITPDFSNSQSPGNNDAVTTTGLYGTDQVPLPNTNQTPLPANAQYYSQATSGFYSSLAHDVWYKHIKTQSDILYSKLNLALSPRLTMTSDTWFRHGYRLHDRVVNFYGPGSGNQEEWYNPTSNMIGNNTHLALELPHDQVTLGGYWIHQGYQNPVAQYNLALGTTRTSPNSFNADHLYNDFGFLFLQDRIELLKKRLIITPAAAEQLFRTAYFNTGLVKFPNANPANDGQQAPSTTKNFLKFSPSVGVQYQAMDWFTVHGNYAITYENPTDGAFGANRATIGVDVSKLEATKAANGEGGFTVTKCPLAILGACSLDATYFHNELSNVSVVTQTAQQTTPASYALAGAIYNGVSINFDNTPSKYFQIHGNAIIQHDYFTTYLPSGSTVNYRGYPISNNPKYTTNLGITSDIQSANHKIDLTPGLWWQYVSYRYLFTNVTNAPTLQTTPGYGVVNFNMDASLNGLLPEWFEKKPLKISFGVENLLNREYNPLAYITSGGYFGTSFGGYTLVDPGAPREYIISLNFGNK